MEKGFLSKGYLKEILHYVTLITNYNESDNLKCIAVAMARCKRKQTV